MDQGFVDYRQHPTRKIGLQWKRIDKAFTDRQASHRTGITYGPAGIEEGPGVLNLKQIDSADRQANFGTCKELTYRSNKGDLDGE